MWSRYPLSDQHNLPGYQLGVLTATVATPGPDATFVAVHLLPPYPYASDEWRTELGHLHAALGRLPDRGPVLVAGDFNATTDHAQFRALLDHGYVDAADQTGAGYLPTYPNDRWYGPIIGIDHVLTRGSVVPDDVQTLGLSGSDHRALLVHAYLPR
jgi:endonuclease/exonuclease/phosphatase (EEP) superfamily protein YafD